MPMRVSRHQPRGPAVGIKYERAALPKPRIYLEGLPTFARRSISLPDHLRLLRELVG
jgi:hypothetical protein